MVELRALFTGDVDLPIRATPGFGAEVEMWMLGSSLFGAQLAARLGLPYAFASHFAPDHLDAALATYREQFRPSAALDKPHAMAAMTVICGETDEEAEHARHLAGAGVRPSAHRRAWQAAAAGRPAIAIRCPNCRAGHARAVYRSPARSARRETVARAGSRRFVERTGADEIIVSGATYDPAARRRSLELTAAALGI